MHGGHAVCTTAPEHFVPALLGACRHVVAGATTPRDLVAVAA